MGVQRLSLGRLSHAALLVLAGWLLRPLPLHAQFFSPGELSKSHASLEGDAHCNDCHSAGRGVSNDKCMSCHADVARTLRQKMGLHGRQYAGRACASCHVDHRGKGHELIRWEPESFDHALTGWPLSSAHQKPACASCHTSKNTRGAATFIGLSRDCASCHTDPHAGRFGDRCQSCHDDVAWKNLDLDPFDHELARFSLRGQHARVACAKCHGTPAKYLPLAFEACGDCHRDPHLGRFGAECESCHSEGGWQKLHMEPSAHPGVSLAGGHRRVACGQCHDRGSSKSPSKGDRCVSCHAPVHEAAFGSDCKACHGPIRWLGLPDELGRRVHDKTSYPLDGKHAGAACDACHSPALPAARRFRKLAFDDCLDCHEDSHRGQFRDREQGACEPCHTTAGFTPTLFGPQAHATTRFGLTGAHEAAPCGTCHTGPGPRLDWQLERLACADCHQNPHGSRFASEMRQGGCATCHSSVAWDLPMASTTGFAHDTWPLTGEHQRVRCDGCHTPTEADRKAGHGESYREAPRECEACHADVHLGQFRLTEPQRGCASCHDTASFRLPAFDHRASTGYALLGKHAVVRCAACHGMSELSDGQRTTLWRLPYDECRDCHANPHVENHE
jgi:hypothetical protein